MRAAIRPIRLDCPICGGALGYSNIGPVALARRSGAIEYRCAACSEWYKQIVREWVHRKLASLPPWECIAERLSGATVRLEGTMVLSVNDQTNHQGNAAQLEDDAEEISTLRAIEKKGGQKG